MGFSHISYNLEYLQLLVSKKLSELLGVKIRGGAPCCEGSFVENLSGNLDAKQHGKLESHTDIDTPILNIPKPSQPHKLLEFSLDRK